MYPHRSLSESKHVDEVLGRLARLQPTSARRWGTMSPHEMVVHLSDSFLAVMGERHASRIDTWFSRTVMKWVALRTPLPWPPGVPTRPEVDPKRGGSRPGEFEQDRAALAALIRRFIRPDTVCQPHPAFGQLSRTELLLWGYGHVDHHLRQFGL